jgi:hypothetical protein
MRQFAFYMARSHRNRNARNCGWKDSGGGAALDLVEPPMDSNNVVSAHAAAAGSVCRDEGILAVGPQDFVAKAFGTLVERAFIVCHQHDPVRADIIPLMKSSWGAGPSVARHRNAFRSMRPANGGFLEAYGLNHPHCEYLRTRAPNYSLSASDQIRCDVPIVRY